MENRLKELLISFDDAIEWEAPDGFVYLDEISKVESIKPIIEELLNEKLEIDNRVQDASFFVDLFILEESQCIQRSNSSSYCGIYDIGIRFSSFRNMVTIFTNTEKPIASKYPINNLIALLISKGYVYISAELLHESYDGINLRMRKGNITWWMRYFDYV